MMNGSIVGMTISIGAESDTHVLLVTEVEVSNGEYGVRTSIRGELVPKEAQAFYPPVAQAEPPHLPEPPPPLIRGNGRRQLEL